MAAFFALPSARIEVLMFAALWRGCILLSLSVYGDVLVYTNWSQCTLMIQKYDDPHENTQERSTAAGRLSLRRVRRPTAAARNRRRPTVMCGGEEGSRLANRILLASQNFLLSFVLVSQGISTGLRTRVRTNPDYQFLAACQKLHCHEQKDNPSENEPTNALSIDDIDVNGYLITDVEQDNGSNRPYDVDVSQGWDEDGPIDGNIIGKLTDLRLFHLSATMSTRPPTATDEASEREEEVAFFLARSRPISRTSRTSSPEPSASSFKFKPPCAELEVV
ncbi:hypothetical protein Tco_0339657 [Tanacetum coccineum]